MLLGNWIYSWLDQLRQYVKCGTKSDLAAQRKGEQMIGLVRSAVDRRAAAVFVMALAARAMAAYAQVAYGLHPIPWLRGLTPWADFYVYYGEQLRSLAQGLLPYRDFAYSYPPLFLYSLYPFYLLGGIHLASIPIVLSDALTAPVIYRMMLKNSPKKLALSAAILYALLPSAVFYEGYVWMSTQPMLLFALLALYYSQQGRATLSGLMMALSILFKQQALFLLPALILWLAKRSKQDALKFGALLGLVLLMASAPFLIEEPGSYLASVSYGLFPASAAPIQQGQSNATSVVASTGPCFISTSPLPTDTSCNYAYITYPHPLFTFLFDLANWISYIAAIPLLISCLPLLIAYGRGQQALALWSSYSMCFLLTLFLYYTRHQIYAYYYLAVYALMALSIGRERGLWAFSLLVLLACVVPEGSVQATSAAAGLIVTSYFCKKS